MEETELIQEIRGPFQTELVLPSHHFKVYENYIHVYITNELPTDEHLHASFDALRILRKDYRIKLVVDPTDAIALNKDQRQLCKQNFEELAEAIAIVGSSLMVKLVSSFILKIDKPKCAVKLFEKEPEAAAWLARF